MALLANLKPAADEEPQPPTPSAPIVALAAVASPAATASSGAADKVEQALAAEVVAHKAEAVANQAESLEAALDALEGPGPLSRSLDGAATQLEAELDGLRPGAVQKFHKATLAQAFNLRLPPPGDKERAAGAVRLLEAIEWPPDSGVPAALHVLRGVAGLQGAAARHSLLQRVSSTVGAALGLPFRLGARLLSGLAHPFGDRGHSEAAVPALVQA